MQYITYLFLLKRQNVDQQFYQLTHKWRHPGTGETNENMEYVSFCHVTMVILRHNVARWFAILRGGDWNPVHSNVLVSGQHLKMCQIVGVFVTSCQPTFWI
jgi:hypothetical protein